MPASPTRRQLYGEIWQRAVSRAAPELGGRFRHRHFAGRMPFEKGPLVTVTMFGIRNCDTIKRARAWLDGRGVAYVFHDYKASGIDRVTLAGWVGEHGWQTILNRAGTTFRRLPDADRDGIDEAKAIDLMLAQPSMIKRPVLDLGGRTMVGFKPEAYAAAFA